MEKLIKLFKYVSDRRYSTIAGTLVYFLLMSLTPLLFWVTLIFGKINLDALLSHSLFAGAAPFLGYLQGEAEGAARGAGIVLIVTSLYSSTNFFYHLRRSGEIIYNVPRKKTAGIKLRLFSLALIIALVVFGALLAAVCIWGNALLSSVIPAAVSECVVLALITALSLAAAIFLNVFACPFKTTIGEVLSGSLLTAALWLVVAAGFNVYLQFASPEKLYGKIAVIFVFLLWCYVMMCCFVVGMIYNGYFKRGREIKKL